VTARRLLVCGKIVAIFGWSTARTIGSTFGRIHFSGTGSRLPRQTPSPLVRLSIAVLVPDAISAAKSISISPQKSSGSSKSLLSRSPRIRYFVMKNPPGSPSLALGRAGVPDAALACGVLTPPFRSSTERVGQNAAQKMTSFARIFFPCSYCQLSTVDCEPPLHSETFTFPFSNFYFTDPAGRPSQNIEGATGI